MGKLFAALMLWLLPSVASAHEVYVLDTATIERAMAEIRDFVELGR